MTFGFGHFVVKFLVRWRDGACPSFDLICKETQARFVVIKLFVS